MSIAVVQLGARMHYAVPRIFYEAGLLHRLYTDICAYSQCVRALRLVPISMRPRSVRKLMDRVPIGIPADKIRSFAAVGLRYAWRLRSAKMFSEQEATAHLRAGSELSRRAIAADLGAATAVYGFNSASLELFQAAKQLGITTIYEQTIAPVDVARNLLREEVEHWPGWEPPISVDEFHRPFEENERQEWALADRIVCGSDFVRKAIAACGGPADRVLSVPYGVSGSVAAIVPLDTSRRKLRVLTVGTVGLRKGAPYVAEAASAMKDTAEFRWVGPITLSDHGQTQVCQHVTLTGAVPRGEMADHYRWADVFLLPSICEGSATVTYEAAQYGLPLVVTPNTGAPLPENAPGVISIRDSLAIVAALMRMVDDPIERERLAKVSQVLASDLTVAAYGKRLLAALPANIAQGVT